MSNVILALLWFSTVVTGLFAGVCLAFSGFVMPGLARTPERDAARAMNGINDAFVKTLMLPLFLVSALASLILLVIGILAWGSAAGPSLVAGGLAYLVGMFLWTVIFNVPRNNALMKADLDSEGGITLWRRYLREWTMHNHVRMLFSTFALICFIRALIIGP